MLHSSLWALLALFTLDNKQTVINDHFRQKSIMLSVTLCIKNKRQNIILEFFGSSGVEWKSVVQKVTQSQVWLVFPNTCSDKCSSLDSIHMSQIIKFTTIVHVGIFKIKLKFKTINQHWMKYAAFCEKWNCHFVLIVVLTINTSISTSGLLFFFSE